MKCLYQSYDDYVVAQKARWAMKKANKCLIDHYARDLKHYISYVESGQFNYPAKILCNGVRNKHEIECMSKLFSDVVEIKGTDIATGGSENEALVMCDFSSLPKAWTAKFDLIYSNALDHSFDVTSTLQEWVRCLSDSGVIVIRFLFGVKPTESDPSQPTRDELESVFVDMNLKFAININDDASIAYTCWR